MLDNYLPKHILITGGSGFIGRALVASLHQQGCDVTVLTRSAMATAKKLFHQAKPIESLQQFEPNQPLDGVINLAGASLAAKRWSERYKAEIVASRVETTAALTAWLQQRPQPPKVLLSGSAIGFYGPAGDEALTESSLGVDSFSHRLCRDWEEATAAVEQQGVRRIMLRTGVVLGREGGSLPEMQRSLLAKMVVHFGTGRQWLSWVHLHDYIKMVLWLLQRDDIAGPVNMTAPQPVTNYQFMATLKRVHRGWLQLPMPAVVARLLLGEMADELLLTGQRVIPQRLLEAGFEFDYPELEPALRQLRQ